MDCAWASSVLSFQCGVLSRSGIEHRLLVPLPGERSGGRTCLARVLQNDLSRLGEQTPGYRRRTIGAYELGVEVIDRLVSEGQRFEQDVQSSQRLGNLAHDRSGPGSPQERSSNIMRPIIATTRGRGTANSCRSGIWATLDGRSPQSRRPGKPTDGVVTLEHGISTAGYAPRCASPNGIWSASCDGSQTLAFATRCGSVGVDARQCSCSSEAQARRWGWSAVAMLS